ncbi:hypothetical protein GOBAR_DD36245 [Gossypium barbadense]|nr:hypothetical protein GOBAR_DD36245 [Gossypium barbadense]
MEWLAINVHQFLTLAHISIIFPGNLRGGMDNYIVHAPSFLTNLQMIESSAHGDEYDGVVFSQLNLIDLAGSESSKTETTGLRRKEGSYINKSLLTLGTVIGKLSEGKASHVPYRDSKLTRLLQSSLSGHGHVSLICTVTPASSNMEETHNTLKFASRAKRVEIYASRNKIIDEKSLIKKYQREISVLKEELDHLRQGMLIGVNHEELMTLRQKLEEGQVKMKSRLEEEEEAKAALMSRIQRLTKLILVSSKNSISGLSDVSSHQRIHSVGEDDKLDGQGAETLVIDSENQKDPLTSIAVLASDPSYELKHRRSSSRRNDELSPTSSTATESTQAENDLANMWVLVAKLKKEGVATPESNTDEQHGNSIDNADNPKANSIENNRQVSDVSSKPAIEMPKEEPLVVRLKARMQEMKEKELNSVGNGDAHSHLCKYVNHVRLLVPSVQFVAQ